MSLTFGLFLPHDPKHETVALLQAASFIAMSLLELISKI